MKKFLSTLLALAMVASMYTVGASAAEEFTDAKDIQYSEAVDVMRAVGIVDGYTDGAFHPQVELNRGQAAKIICNLILGPTTASALNADTAPYKDVPADHHFAGYIAYCQQQGIINGYADGTFRPTNPLTNYAFMKMLLGALGYDSGVEGYTGANWSINVAKQAMGIKLHSGLVDDFVGNDVVTREEAMLYAFNTMQANMVDYSEKTEITDASGNVNVIISGRRFEVENKATNETIKNDDYMQFAEKYFPKLTNTHQTVDAFGRPATQWKYKSEMVGTYTDYSDLVAEYTTTAPKGKLYNTIGASIVKSLKDSNTGSYGLDYYVDGKELPSTTNLFFNKNDTGAAGASGNGVLTQVFMDDNNNVTITMINTYLMQATADYNSAKEELVVQTIEVDKNGAVTPVLPSKLSSEDFDVADYAEDDYILVNYSHMTKDIESIEKAELLTGEVSEYTVKDYVVLDDTTYYYNQLVGNDEKSVEYAINANAKVVKDAFGYILYVDEAVSTGNYVFIQDAVGTTNLNKKVTAAAYFADGTYDEITVEKVDGKTGVNYMLDQTGDKAISINGNPVEVNLHGWYTYVKDADGNYTLTTPNNQKRPGSKVNASTDTTIMTNNKVKFLSGSSMDTGIRGNASTVFVVLDSDGDVHTYKGIANAPTITLATGTANAIEVNYLADQNNYATYVFVDLTGDAGAVVEDTKNIADFLMILDSTDNKTVVADGETYYQYKVLFDGKVETRYIAASVIGNIGNVQGALGYNIKSNSKGYITRGTMFVDKNNNGKSTHQVLALTGAGDHGETGSIEQKGNTLTIHHQNGAQDYIVTGNTEINLVVGDDVYDLLTNDSAAYETHLDISASQLANSFLEGSAISGTVYAVVEQDGSESLETLYVFVKESATIS